MKQTTLSITVKEYKSHIEEEAIVSGDIWSVVPTYFLLGAKIFWN
jgi:hypothetical protein